MCLASVQSLSYLCISSNERPTFEVTFTKQKHATSLVGFYIITRNIDKALRARCIYTYKYIQLLVATKYEDKHAYKLYKSYMKQFLCFAFHPHYFWNSSPNKSQNMQFSNMLHVGQHQRPQFCSTESTNNTLLKNHLT